MTPTTVLQQQESLPISVLEVEVVAGPDSGKAVTARGETLSVGTADDNDLVLTDKTVSRFHLELATRPNGVLVVDHGSTNGTTLAGARLEKALVSPGTVLELGDTQIRVIEGGDRTVPLHETNALFGIRGKTMLMRRLMAQVKRVGQSDVAVLVIGDSGTGKELIAQALHDSSQRSKAPLITVDCGALSPNLVASELFGHERGAFTGATRQHIGAFERANGGTVFLDEIGELPMSLQTNLLGVLERRRLRRVGGHQDIDIDIRLLSATHHDLRTDVNVGTFRLDLYYRLAVVTLRVPPLRERSADIPILVEHFLRQAGYHGPVNTVITPQLMSTYAEYRWPGNVRELRNSVEAILAMGEELSSTTHMSVGAERGSLDVDVISRALELDYKAARAAVLVEFESRYLKRILEKAGDNISEAARQSKMNRSHLSELVRRHKITSS